MPGPATADAATGPASGVPVIIPFEGLHQAGIDRPGIAQPNAVLAAFDVVAPDRDGLTLLFAELTRRIRDLTAGTPPPPIDDAYPPPESGVLGPSIGPSSLTITIAVGASLFDDRYGLGDRKPAKLRPMPHFRGDVMDASRTHGDLLIQVCAVDEMACIHALRYLMAGSRAQMALRWMEHGFHRPDAIAAEGKTTTRNLLGFKDGTANPPVGGDDFSSLVWVTPDDAEPAWATEGSYMAVRLIRMFVERWDRAPLAEQEAIIGRTKRTGAPHDGRREEDIPDFAADPQGTTTALDAHIRLANPRTPDTERNRIFRRGYSFSRGFDDAGPARPGAGLHLLPARHRRGIRGHPGASRRRAAAGVHPAAGRRLLLRPARRRGARRDARRGPPRVAWSGDRRRPRACQALC